MGYHHLDPATIDASSDHPCDRRSITETVGLSQLAMARYELAPGEQLSTQYHYHEQREEALYVLDGTLHVETPEKTYVVSTDELFVVTPESPLLPFNPESADEPVRVLGVGAPKFDIGQPYDRSDRAEDPEEK